MSNNTSGIGANQKYETIIPDQNPVQNIQLISSDNNGTLDAKFRIGLNSMDSTMVDVIPQQTIAQNMYVILLNMERCSMSILDLFFGRLHLLHPLSDTCHAHLQN